MKKKVDCTGTVETGRNMKLSELKLWKRLEVQEQ